MTGDPRAAVASQPFWYHTIEVAPGVETPGWFDLRPIVDKLPWPDVRGKRCLDVGTFDGFLAFELERRGAAEVVATDVSRPEEWDWAPHLREAGVRYQRENYGERTGRGFEIARELLGSSVRRETVGIYDLSPETVGTFDVVVCGSLLLHLRDPMRALAALRSVCGGVFMSCEQVRLAACLALPRKPVFVFEGAGDIAQWFVPNAAAHRDMLRAAGFRVERESRLYAVPFGVSHPPTGARRKISRRLLTRGDGVPHHAVLASPDPAVDQTSGDR